MSKWLQVHGQKVPRRIVMEAASEDIQFTTVEGAEGEDNKPKLRSFSMVAYTGGAMRPAYFSGRVVVDLGGLRVSAKSRPIFLNHDPSKILGHTDKIDVSGRIHVSGKLSAANESVREVAESADNGFPWQASIGASVERFEYVESGKKATANGRTFEGPVLIARKSFLQEISFVPLGADDNTSAKVAASKGEEDMPPTFEEFCESIGISADHTSDEQMKFARSTYDKIYGAGDDDNTKPEPKKKAVKAAAGGGGSDDGDEDETDFESLKAQKLAELRAEQASEFERGNSIREIAKDHPEICAKALKEGWSKDKTELEVLRASRANVPAIHSVDRSIVDSPEVLKAALWQSLGVKDLDKETTEYGAKLFDEKTLEAAHRSFHGRIGLQELIIHAAYRGGLKGLVTKINKGNYSTVLKAAFSTVSLSGIFSSTMNKFIRQGWMGVESAWREISAIRSVNDFKTATTYSLTGDFQFEELGPLGEIKHGTLGELSYTNAIKTYAKMLSLSRYDIINDDLNALSVAPSRLGRGAMLKFNDIFWALFVANTSFWTAGNGSLVTSAALSYASLKTAMSTWRMRSDPDSKFLNAGSEEPAILLVPPGLEFTAKELLNSSEVRDTTASTKAGTKNVFQGMFRVVVARYLQHASYGNSATTWYLLSEPSVMPVIESAFLNGRETPVVETEEEAFNVLGVQMRGYHDFGVAFQEYRGGLKMTA